MRFCNIVFDLDGTLIDSARLTGVIIDQMLDKRGVDMRASRDLIRKMDAIGGEAMIAAVLGPHSINPAAEIEEFRALHRTTNVPAELPFPGVREALGELSASGIGLAICSNKPQFLCDKILGDLGLAQHFTAIIGSSPDRARKPAPECAQLAVAALRGSSRDTLYCGDSVIDIGTARAAGLMATLVRWGYGTADALKIEPRTPVLESMFALSEALEGHGQLCFPGG